ncbi:hypothetical protein [Roseomonas indoligenes]|uniref:Uncharacterized protein n=1 Tax=Roseomonas indoligenes TaxID=2820811 RepID=A0A940MUY3_9PROT|nr:hypothetical protein [Pararoseomonas indoligenes]MBP0491702.1 hypothetical protein [Pararoseomonas indoligenes]
MDIPPPIQEIDAEAAVQRRIWLASRIAWAAMAAALLLGAAGLFGDGTIAEAEASAPDASLHLRYDRFQRADAVNLFTLVLDDPGEGGEVVLCFDRPFLKEWRISRFEPAPDREEARGEDLCGHFLADPAVRPAVLRLWAAPRTSGFGMEGAIYRPGRAPLPVSAAVWP